jgi:hypothetical protein
MSLNMTTSSHRQRASVGLDSKMPALVFRNTTNETLCTGRRTEYMNPAMLSIELFCDPERLNLPLECAFREEPVAF